MTECNCDSTNPYMGPWHAIGCCRMYAPTASATDPLHATYTAAEVKVLTEAALRLGRKEAGEEIAEAMDAYPGGGMISTSVVAMLARNLVSLPAQAASDAASVPSEGPGTSEPSNAAKTPREPS